MTSITWSSWGPQQATATGTLMINNGIPNCAQGTWTAHPDYHGTLSAPEQANYCTTTGGSQPDCPSPTPGSIARTPSQPSPRPVRNTPVGSAVETAGGGTVAGHRVVVAVEHDAEIVRAQEGRSPGRGGRLRQFPRGSPGRWSPLLAEHYFRCAVRCPHITEAGYSSSRSSALLPRSFRVSRSTMRPDPAPVRPRRGAAAW